MKLLEKLKNTFFEEEYVEVEEPKQKAVAKKVEVKENKKEPVVKRKVEPDLVEEKTPEVEEDKDSTIEKEEPVIHYSDNELSKDSKLPYFEDEDFMDTNQEIENKIEEPKKLYGGSVESIYSSIHFEEDTHNKPYGNSSKGAFQPTPIISPIYGILDKNYRKEEVVDKKQNSSYVARQSVDLDSIRQKAYGTVDEIEENSSQIVDEIQQDIEEESKAEDELLYDMTSDNTTPVVDQVTIADAEEYFEDLGLEYNIDYKDNHYEKATGRRTTKIKKQEEIEDSDDEAKLEDNLFDVIDSMYDEEGEEE